MPFTRISDAIQEIRRGKAILLVDDEDSESGGKIVVAAQKITPDGVNFMAKHGRGLVCLALTEQRAAALELPLMARDDPYSSGSAFTVSIEAREGVSTGISAADRARTILTAVDPRSTARDLCRPGHVFPLLARPGGAMVRAGHSEGAVDLAMLAGFKPAGVLCDVLNAEGSLARRDELLELARKFELAVVSIADLISFRRAKEKLVYRYVELDLPFIYGAFHAIVYRSNVDDSEHFAFTKGDVASEEPVLVRVQTSIQADAFNADLGLPSILAGPMKRIEKEGRGAMVFVGQPGGGERAGDTFRRYAAGEQASPPMPRDEADRLRDYGLGAQILVDLGVRRMRLLTNRPRPIVGLDGFDLSVDEIVPLGGESQES